MIGETLSHYRILEKLGEGGMGEVFLADDTSLGRQVALKFLPPGLQQDAAAHKRFLREAHSAAALDHPFICHINEVAEAGGRDFIVMEYVAGQSLKDRLAQGPLSAGEALPIAIEIAEALEAAHGKGIVHRDIKPGNVMLTPTGHAKVMDFGVAKVMGPSAGLETAAATVTGLTSDGSTVGTLAYMSPEQLRGQGADGRSDLWALGVTLYEMVAGTRPFQGQSEFEVTAATLNEAPRPLPAHVPTELAAVIARCLEKDPAKRYQQASELRQALVAVQAGTGSPWVGWRYRLTRRRWPLAAAVLLALATLAALLVALDVGGIRSRLVNRAATPARIVKLAVLPFANVSGDAEQDYLSDGLTTEMIALLGRLHPETLHVIARTTAMRYKKTEKPIDQIGRELGVDYVLEGSAQKEAGRIRITADLIKVADQTQLWAERYERELAGVLMLQNEVAQQVAKALALKLLPAEQARLAGARAVNPDAYEACLKGFQHADKLTPDELDTALHYFEMALAKDLNYALAYAGIAWVWIGRNQMGISTPGEAVPKAKAAALKAVELDETLPEAHLMRGLVWGAEHFNTRAVEAEEKRAIELNPNYADARAVYSHTLNQLGRPQEAMAQIDRATELDPFNPLTQAFRAVDLMWAHRYDECLALCDRMLRTDPNSLVALMTKWEASVLAGKPAAEAFAAAKAYLKVMWGGSDLDAALDQGYAQGGYPEAMRRAADILAARSRTTFVVPSDVATLYLEAGQTTKALDWLEKAFEAHDPSLGYLGMPDYDRLRGEPRFQALLRKMNLPQ